MCAALSPRLIEPDIDRGQGAVLALDPGERFVGVAASDPDRRMAFAVKVIDTKKSDVLSELQSLAAERNTTEIIIGRPTGLRGSAIPMTAQAEQLAHKVTKALGLPVTLVDERLSSREAERQGTLIGRRSDAAAAALLLQAYLDRQQTAA